MKSWTRAGHLQAEAANKMAEWFEAGLADWDISRDAPYFGFEIPDAPGKYFYVWLDAPIGYMGSFAKRLEADGKQTTLWQREVDRWYDPSKCILAGDTLFYLADDKAIWGAPRPQGGEGGAVIARRAADGEELWSFTFPERPHDLIVANGRLFVTFEYIATVGEPNTTGPVTGFPAAPEGASQEEAFVFYVNFLRQQAGLQPVVRNTALDRESAYWSQFRANGGCESTGGACNRRDMPTVLKATLGTGRTRWWSAAVGMTYASDPSAQVAWFANSSAMRKMLLRKDANMIGVGLASDAEGITYMTLALVQVKDVNKVKPNSANTCGWIQPTLKVRSKGPYVRVAQCAMTERGFWQTPADGIYTTGFAEAVKQFQTANNLRATGTLDLKTRRALGVI